MLKDKTKEELIKNSNAIEEMKSLKSNLIVIAEVEALIIVILMLLLVCKWVFSAF